MARMLASISLIDSRLDILSSSNGTEATRFFELMRDTECLEVGWGDTDSALHRPSNRRLSRYYV